VKKTELYIEHNNEMLHVVRWEPCGEVRAVLQIVHGMVEHIERYAPFAEYLCSNGVAVVGHDHPGHGRTAADKESLGFIERKGGDRLLVECAYRVTEWIRESFGGKPNFILGHSMGSFVVRRYMTEHSGAVCGAVVMGTGTPPVPILSAGRAMAGAIGKIFGKHHRSPFLKSISFAGYNSRFPKEEGANAWLSSDAREVKKYNDDPLCGYTFTASAFGVLYDLLYYVARLENSENIRKDLPVLIVSGEDDPVGDYGKAPMALSESFKSLGLSDCEYILYSGARHEILNEKCNSCVREDVLSWIDKHLIGEELI